MNDLKCNSHLKLNAIFNPPLLEPAYYWKTTVLTGKRNTEFLLLMLSFLSSNEIKIFLALESLVQGWVTTLHWALTRSSYGGIATETIHNASKYSLRNTRTTLEPSIICELTLVEYENEKANKSSTSTFRYGKIRVTVVRRLAYNAVHCAVGRFGKRSWDYIFKIFRLK